MRVHIHEAPLTPSAAGGVFHYTRPAQLSEEAVTQLINRMPVRHCSLLDELLCKNGNRPVSIRGVFGIPMQELNNKLERPIEGKLYRLVETTVPDAALRGQGFYRYYQLWEVERIRDFRRPTRLRLARVSA